MLRYGLTHPELAAALAGAGHGATVLLADGNYPLSTGSAATAKRIYLNLRPGMVPVDDILATVLDAVPVEAAQVMRPHDGSEPPIFASFRSLLAGAAGPAAGAWSSSGASGGGVELEALDRFDFYAAAREPDLAVAVASGDQRVYANILLTIGVVTPPA